MNTHQATQESALDRLRADMAKRDSDRDAGISKLGSAMDQLRADMAKRDADMAKRDADMAKRDAARDVDMAKRDKDNTRWMIGMWVATVVVLGALITWPL